jgi:shikimate kinase
VTPKVILVGLPGTGKSTTGRRLARMLVVPFADSDELVEQATGRTVRDIFADDGEAAFRALEAEAIAAALEGFDGVLALGGGALTTDSTRAAIAASGIPVARLQATLATLAARVGDGHTRPLLADDPAARLAELAEQRDVLYAEVATLNVQTAERPPGQVAAHIAAKIHKQVST